MAEDKKEVWITWLALTTAFLAVFAAVTTMFMGKYSNRAILIQGQESNQWAYYQAKSIKGHTYEIQKQKLELELAAQHSRMQSAVVEKYREVIRNYSSSVIKYEKDKAEIKAAAENLAGQKDGVQKISANLSFSLIFLQIAIVLSSVAAITKKKQLWYFGLFTSLGWVVYFVNAFFSLF
jgi:Spy/CpxP family protein refolding chaperone